MKYRTGLPCAACAADGTFDFAGVTLSNLSAGLCALQGRLLSGPITREPVDVVPEDQVRANPALRVSLPPSP